MLDRIPVDIGHVLRRAATATFCSIAMIGAALPASAKEPLTGSVQLDQPIVLGGGNTVVYAVVNFEGIDVDPGAVKERPPLNLSLVLDRSGSMSDEGKIEYLRRAAKLAVDRLGNRDTLSIVEYDDTITLMWPARRVGNTGEVKAMIDRLDPRGSTNLTGGMMRGVDEAKNALGGPARADGTITRVILMSDGLANVGVTNPQEIAGLVRGAKHDGIRISAMGLGRELFSNGAQKTRATTVPLIVSTSLHALAVATILFIASLGFAVADERTEPIKDEPIRLVFLATPGPGGGGGGGGLKFKTPPPKAQRKGIAKISSPVPARALPPCLAGGRCAGA